MSAEKLRITLLADEWNSSKGGLSTMNRELAIQLAKHPNVAVTFFVPKCSEVDKKAACGRNISIVEAIERYGYDEVDWLSFPPRDLVIDVIIGHGVKLGKQAQVIRGYHGCSCWVQVVHTAPEELAMFKTYPGAISKGDEKQWAEVKLCTIADLVVAVGPKLYDIYSRYLSRSGKKVINLTPGIFTELSDLKQSTQGSKKFWVLVFGRGESEDFELKGFDIAAKAVAELNDKSYQLIFVGAPSGNGEQVAEKLLEQGLSRNQLTVKGYLENRDDLATLLSTANLAIIPSRTEGFGLTALEALSAGLPFLVSQNSGFGEALREVPSGSSWIIDSEDPKQWAKAIKGVREKGRETALEECQELRTRYAEKYSWEKQCNDLVEMMRTLVGSTSEAQMPQPGSVSEPEKNRAEDKSVQPLRRRNSLQEDQSITEQRTEDTLFSGSNNVEQRRKLHLFNCDRTYKLDAVEELLKTKKAKLGFDSVEKHYFSLVQMEEMTTNVIPKLQMDMAFFVVHAEESRLSINEENTGLGYTMIYRALLQETGENVIIVIGGDDNYKNEDEEDQFVISRWAKRKISSQFSEELLDGRKGFIFSWDKKHRPIHEEALVHYFDPSKRGLKFEYQPATRKLPIKPVTPSPVRSTKAVQPLKLYGSLPEDHIKYRREESFASSSTDSQARKDNVPSDSVLGEGRKDISQSDIWKTKPKDLAILGCGVPDESMKAVRRVFNDLSPVLGVSTDTAVEKFSPASAKSYLLRNPLKFCVLVVDAKTVKDVYERSAQGRVEFEDLLRTATNEVVEKVILVICSADALFSLKDEAIFTEKVGGIFQGSCKGIVVWMKHSLLTVEPDILAQMIMAPGSPFESTKSRTSYRDDFSRPRYTTQSLDPDGTDRQEQTGRSNARFPQHEMCYGRDARWKDRTLQQSQGLVPSQITLPPSVTRFTAHFNSKGELLLLKTRLRHGKLSYHPKDVDILYPGFQVPRHIEKSLYEKHLHTSEAVVKIVKDPKSSEVRWSVDSESKGFFTK